LTHAVLTVRNLHKHFRTPQGTVKAVNGVSFSVRGGEILGLVGESGSGKSTVAYCIVGIYSPSIGKLLFREQDISTDFSRRSKGLKREIQMVFQDPGSSLNPRQNIKQNLAMPLIAHRFSNKRMTERVIELLEMVGLSVDYLYKLPYAIGGGEKQMVAIARSLATEPSLVVLDEPTSALDVSMQAKIIHLLLKWQKELSLTYLFITHDLGLMRNVATRVAIMYLGKISEMASASEFFERPLHPYTQMLLSSIPVITEDEEALKPEEVVSRGEIPSPVNTPSGCGFHPRCQAQTKICCEVDPEAIEVEEAHMVRCHMYKRTK